MGAASQASWPHPHFRGRRQGQGRRRQLSASAPPPPGAGCQQQQLLPAACWGAGPLRALPARPDCAACFGVGVRSGVGQVKVGEAESRAAGTLCSRKLCRVEANGWVLDFTMPSREGGFTQAQKARLSGQRTPAQRLPSFPCSFIEHFENLKWGLGSMSTDWVHADLLGNCATELGSSAWR